MKIVANDMTGEETMSQQILVTKTFTFDSAHQLLGHEGKCANVHGHTYQLEVTIKGPVNNVPGASDEGFVMDFADLKQVVKTIIIDHFDHAFIAKGDEPVVEVLKQTGSKVVELGFRTTAERLAAYIFNQLTEAGLPVHRIKLYETPTSWAVVEGGS